MTREDMMRELELLPVWQLRVPVSETVEIKDISPVPIRQNVELKPDLQTQLLESTVKESLANPDKLLEVLMPMSSEPPIFTHIASENGEYLFVLSSAEMRADELQLFQNVCKALQINTKAAEKFAYISQPNNVQAKLLIVLGEAKAQAI